MSKSPFTMMMCHRLKNITNRSIESIRSSSSRLKKKKKKKKKIGKTKKLKKIKKNFSKKKKKKKKKEKNLKSRKTEKNHSIATVFRDNNFKSRGMSDIGINLISVFSLNAPARNMNLLASILFNYDSAFSLRQVDQFFYPRHFCTYIETYFKSLFINSSY